MPASSFGRFTVLGEIGAGGMGRVFRAHDPTLGREIAIKVLREDLAGPRGNLLAEARSASRLNHPHICTIYDVGEVDHVPFIAMELVEGRPLSELIVAGGLPLGTVLPLTTQIAAALSHAHAHGVVHGDLKGQNIVVSAAGNVKLLDFGLARAPAAASLESITRPASPAGATDGMAGTLPFMAPETLRGAPLAPGSDVWAFGVLLYEMVAGVRPFTGGSAYDVAAAILNQPPPALPTSVPAGLSAVILRCLDKSPARRYATAREPLVALEALAAGGAPPAATPRPARAWIAAAVVAVVIVGGLVWAWRRPLIPGPADVRISSLVVLPFDNLSKDQGEDYFAEGMTDALAIDLARIPTLTVISRMSAARYKKLGKTTREIADELHVGGIVDGTVARSAGQVRISVRLVEAATDRIVWGRDYTRELKDVLALQGDVARAIATEIRASFGPADVARLTRARPVQPAAYEELLKGRYQWNRRSPDSLMQAIGHFRRATDLAPDYAAAYAGLAQSYVVLPIFPLGLMSPSQALPEAVRAAERAIALDDRVAEAHTALAYARLFLDGFKAADAGFQQALAISPGDATTHFWYAAALASDGQFDRAIERARHAAALDPVSPIVRTGVSWMQHLARRFDREVEEARAALALDPNFLVAHVRLSAGLLHLGRYDEAVPVLERARSLSGGTPDLIAAVGHGYGRAGRRREAQAALDELKAIAASGKRYVSPFAFAIVHLSLGQRDEAFRWLSQSVDERGPVVPFLDVEPELDPLRSDPRFAALVSRARSRDIRR